jgi:hypothetical protein
MVTAKEWRDWFADSMFKEEAIQQGFGKEMNRHKWTCLMKRMLEQLGEKKGFCVKWEVQKVDMVWYSRETSKLEVAIEHELRGDKMDRLKEGEIKSLREIDAPLSVLIVCFRPTKNFSGKLKKLEDWVCSQWNKQQNEFLVLAARRRGRTRADPKDYAPEGRWEAYRATKGMSEWEALDPIEIPAT